MLRWPSWPSACSPCSPVVRQLMTDDRWHERQLFDECPNCDGRGRDRYGECDRCDGTGQIRNDLEDQDPNG